MKTILWTYRAKRISSWFDINGTTLNGNYTPSFFLDLQFADYKEAWLTKILDNEIPEERYTWEIIPGVKKLSRLIIAEYNDAYINWEEFFNNVAKVWAEFNIEAFATNEEAKQWIRNNTNLVEVEEWKFLISEATEFMWEIIPEKYLIID